MNAFILSMTLSAMAVGSPDQKTEEPKPEGAKPEIVYQKRTIVSFTETAVLGQVVSPMTSWIESRGRARFVPLLRVRDNFKPEILASADNL